MMTGSPPVGATEAAMDQAADDERLRRLQRLAFGAVASDAERAAAIAELELIRLERAADDAGRGRTDAGGAATVPASPDATAAGSSRRPGIRASGAAATRRLRWALALGAAALIIGVAVAAWRAGRLADFRLRIVERGSLRGSRARCTRHPDRRHGRAAALRRSGLPGGRAPRRVPPRQHRADGVPAAPHPPRWGVPLHRTPPRRRGDLRCRDAARRLHRVELHARRACSPRPDSGSRSSSKAISA